MRFKIELDNKKDMQFLKKKSFNLVEYLDEKLKDLALEDQFEYAGRYLSEIDNLIVYSYDGAFDGKLIKGKHYVDITIECEYCNRCGMGYDIWVDNEVKELK